MSGSAPESATTLTEVMRRRAAMDPDGQYFSLWGDRVTYGRLWQESARYAAGLARAGVGRGDAVALVYPTCAEFFCTFFGALRLGAVPVPLYPTLGIDGLGAILHNADAVCVATTGWSRMAIDEARKLAPGVRSVVEPPDLEAAAVAPRLVEPAEEDLAFLQYTSGSTGRPRGVMLTHRNVVETVKFMAEAVNLSPADRAVSWLPLYHDMGLIGCGFTPPLRGTPLWLLPPDLRNPREWLELITSVRATFTVSPDFGYRNCVRNVRDTTGLDLGSLRGAWSGAEPVRQSTIEAFERHFGLTDVVAPAYGLAEATLAVAIWPFGTPRRLDPSGKFVSPGRPCQGVSVRIAPPADLDDPDFSSGASRAQAGATPALGPLVEGEICVRSPGVMRGFYNDPEATRRVLGPDGWLRTGDLGFVDAEGYLFVTGRIKDVIILGGENVPPADVEELVDHVAGVRYAAAVGIDSERTGSQRLHVVVEVRNESAPPDDYHRLVGEIVRRVHDGRGHRPGRVHLVRAGTIPKTSSGKIQRARLAAMVRDGELAGRLVYTGVH